MRNVLLFVVLSCLLAFGICNVAAETYELSLEPGEGAILLLGRDDTELADVQKDYFGPSPQRRPRGPLDRLLVGPLSGADMRIPAKRMGLSHKEYMEQVIKLYADIGSTVAFAYRSDMGTNDGKVFAKIAARHGLKAILSPADVYWREPYHQKKLWKAKLAEYGGCEGYTEKYLIPMMKKYAPKFKNDKNIYGWQLTEEIYWKSEPYYTPYKKAFKRLFPKQLLFQIDSQQLDRSLLKHKQRPYPDIMGADFYPFFANITRDETRVFYPAPWKAVGLATPHYATKSLYLNMRQYPKAVYDLFKKPAVMVLAGTSMGMMMPKSQGIKAGYQACEGFVNPKARGSVRWIDESDSFLTWHYYLAPTNAYRLQHWIGVACGFKGFMYWSIGPLMTDSTDLERAMREGYADGKWKWGSMRRGLINWDFSTHRHLREIKDSWKEIRRYETLILDTHPIDSNERLVMASSEPYVYTGLLKDSAGRIYLVVVNGQIGLWDKDSPEVLSAKSTLSVNQYGELKNYTPLRKPRKITVTLPSTSRQLFDLRTMKPLTR